MKRIIYTFMCISSLLLSSCTNLLEPDGKITEDKTTTKAVDLETVEITLEAAGTLAEKLGDKSAIVEKLVVSGPFDADDVITMRKLPKLQAIDMKGVTIAGGEKTYHSTINGIASKLSDNAIGDFMFNGMQLTEIILPSNAIAIGAIAFGSDNPLFFSNNNTFETIVIPETVKSIGDAAFRGCPKLNTIVIPEGVKTLGSEVLRGCGALKNVTLPISLEKIPSFMFDGCSSLATVVIPQEVKRIENGAFSNCTALKDISLPARLEFLGGAFGNSGLTSITIPNSVTKIDASIPIGSTDLFGAFEGCKSLSSVTLSNNLVNLGSRTFANCTALTNIVIPESVLEISHSCFLGSALIHVELPQTLQTINEYAFAYTPIENITLPDGLLIIGARAFLNCKQLKSITIPKSVTLVGGGSFGYCYGLTSIYWNTSIPFPNIYYHKTQWEVTDGGNLNCLLYLADESTKIDYTGWKNIIINGIADQIVLSSQKGDFHCPQAFKVLKISYTQEFKHPTYSQESAGWRTLSLPFTVSRIKHEDGRVLAPFNHSTENAKPFWLRRLTANGFENVTTIEAGIPYIISMPNNEKYAAEYRITGKVTFSAEDATSGIDIPVTTTLPKEEGPSFMLCSNYMYVPQSASVYVLNEDNRDRRAGSVFVRSERDALPFEAYVTTKKISAKGPRMYSIDGNAKTRSTHVIGNKPSIDDM